MNTPPMLIVEDDRDLAGELHFFLQRHGFQPELAHQGADVEPWVREHRAGVVLLDLGLPDEDGIDVARRLADWADLRVVMLTARSTLDDRIEGFRAGADVYLTKPVDLRELLAVVQRVSGRLPAAQALWSLNVRHLTLRAPDGQELALTAQELLFVELLAESAEQGADRRRIEQHLWGSQQIDTDRRLEVMVARLRKKLRERCGNDDLLKTRWRGGYQITAPMVVQG